MSSNSAKNEKDIFAEVQKRLLKKATLNREQHEANPQILLKNPEFVITGADIDKMDDGDEVPFIQINKTAPIVPEKGKVPLQKKPAAKVSKLNPMQNFVRKDCVTIHTIPVQNLNYRVAGPRSATQDAAETMLRLEDGVPSSSTTKRAAKPLMPRNSNINSVDVNDFKPVQFLGMAPRSHVIQRSNVTQSRQSVVYKPRTATRYEVNPQDRERLVTAYDANDDLKFCEWVLSVLKNKTKERKDAIKRGIAHIVLN